MLKESILATASEKISESSLSKPAEYNAEVKLNYLYLIGSASPKYEYLASLCNLIVIYLKKIFDFR